MAVEVMLPVVGESIDSAVISAWLRNVGDTVRRGDEIVEVETDKATMAIEAPADGVVLAVLAEVDAVVRPGQVIAVIGSDGEVWPPTETGPATEHERVPAPESEATEPTDGPLATSPASESTGYRITPAARARAIELGIEIGAVVPLTGDKVNALDVDQHAVQANSAVSSHRVELTPIRKATGRRMLESVQTTPQFSVSADAPVEALIALRRRWSASDQAVSFTGLLVHVVARVLERHPLLNATFAGDAVTAFDVVNVAVAVASPDGLRVPVVKDAARRPIEAISADLGDLIDRARGGALTVADNADATFTISNLGPGAVRSFVPIVNPPQSAILGVGAVASQLVPEPDGSPVARQSVTLTVSADHRVVDGADAAAFLTDLVAAIGQPDVIEDGSRS